MTVLYLLVGYGNKLCYVLCYVIKASTKSKLQYNKEDQKEINVLHDKQEINRTVLGHE